MQSGAMVHIVIPTHNRRELTRACLEALRRQTFQSMRIVVADDGSTDGTWEMLGERFPEVVRIRGDGRQWWTGATNLGCAWVLANAPQTTAVITLNDDTEPSPDWLGALVNASRELPNALVGSLVSDRGTGETFHAGQFVDWWTARYTAPWCGCPADEVRGLAGDLLPTDLLTGMGTLIPLRALQQLGPYDAALPQYGADYEYSRRAVRNGWELAVSASAVLPHHTQHTGLHARRGENLSTLLRSLWSIRSSTGWPYRVSFAMRACPRLALPSYLVCDAARIVAESVGDFIGQRLPARDSSFASDRAAAQ